MNSDAIEDLLEQLGADPDDLLNLGEKSAQESQGAMYGPLPQPGARAAGLEHKSNLQVFYHAPTGAFVTIPTDE